MLLLLLSFGCSNLETSDNVYQQTLDLPGLQQYYHINEVPGRTPLVVVTNPSLSPELGLKKFGQPVKILTKEEIELKKIDAYLEFMNIIRKENTITIIFEYAAEGVVGEVIFKEKKGNWRVVKHQIIEQ
jgi:hypothetical protein